MRVENGQPPSPNSSHPNGSHQSPPGSPALNEQNKKYHTFSFSDKEGETDDSERIQLIQSEQGLGNETVTVTEETSKVSDPVLQSKAVNVYFHRSVGRLESYASSLYYRRRLQSLYFKYSEFL